MLFRSFEVELLIHAAFAEKTPIRFDLETVQWNLQGIDNLLNLLVESVFGDIAGNQAGNQAERVQPAEYQAKEAFELLDSNQVSTIAGGIAGGIAEKQIAILKQCRKPKIREDVLSAIKLSNQRKNYVDYMLPLVAFNWLTMTIPNKPTSPNQKYLTTLKGRLVLEFLKRNTK